MAASCGSPSGRLANGRVYGLHGLRVRSPVPLAGFPAAGTASDVDVSWGHPRPVPSVPPPGRLVVGFPQAAKNWYSGVDDGERLTLRVPARCDFVIDRRLRLVECRPDPAVDARLVGVLLVGLVIGFLLTSAGECALHASAVEVDGLATAFAGGSGTGKSTLAAIMCGAGARLVADDLVRVRFSERVRCVAGGPQLRLRPQAAWALDGFSAPPPSTATVDERLAITPPATVHADVPLAVILVPQLSRQAAKIRTRRLSGAAGLAQLISLARVLGWQDKSVLRAQFGVLSRLATGVPVVEVVIPWGSSSATAIAPSLLELARGHR